METRGGWIYSSLFCTSLRKCQQAIQNHCCWEDEKGEYYLIMVAHNCQGKTKNVTAKTKPSRQKQKPHGKTKIPNGKTKNLTAKTKYLMAKPKTVRFLVLLWGILFLPWSFWFCCEVFVFAVRFLVLLWQLWATVLNTLRLFCQK